MIEEEIKLFIIYLYRKHPFYNSLISNINFFIDSSEESNKYKIYSPKFKDIVLDKNFSEELIKSDIKKFFYYIIHEIIHMILKHPNRQNGRDKRLWDIASDISVDTIIKSDQELIKILNFKAPDTDFTHKDTVDDIYSLIYELYPDTETDEKEDCEESDDCSSCDNNSEPTLGESKAKKNSCDSKTNKQQNSDELNELKSDSLDNHECWSSSQNDEDINEETNKMLLDAMEFANEKAPGGSIGGFSEMIGKLLTPKTNLKEYLNKIVQDFIDISYTYKRGDRRYLYNNLIVPSTIEDIKHFKLLFYVDTSGSMDIDGLTQSISEIIDIVDSLESFEITVIQSDSGIQDIKTITQDNMDVSHLFEMKGRGGTELAPLFEYIKDEENTFDAIIVNSDFHIMKNELEEYVSLEYEKNLLALIPKRHGDIELLNNIFYLDEQ